MKSISVSDYVHKIIMDEKDSEYKSADAVILRLFTEHRELVSELADHLVCENIIVPKDVKKIIDKQYNRGVESQSR